MEAQARSVVLITGCSSGIGLATAIYLAQRGCKVYATVRNLEKTERLLSLAKEAGVSLEVLQLDVTDAKSVEAAVRSIHEREGRIDALVNNAGFGSAGFFEDFSMEEIRDQFETNFFGLARVTKAVLPIMRERREGHIVNMSSIVGKMAQPHSPIYSASKFAVEGLTEALRVQLAPFGIKVATVEPPYVRTNFIEAERYPEKSQSRSSPYFEETIRIEQMMRRMSQGRMSVEPLSVARRVHAAITSPTPRRSYPVGLPTQAFLILRSILPNRLIERMQSRQFSNVVRG